MNQIKIKYPVRIENDRIVDKNNISLEHGRGDCCGVGGIWQMEVMEAIVESLNKLRPKISYYDEY